MLEIVNLSGWTFGFVIANQLAVFVVSAIAVSIGTASLTAYTYASIFFQLPFGIVAVSVMTTMAPVLASRFTTGDTAGFAEQFGLGLRRTMAGVIPAVVGYLLLARPAISLISLGAGSARHSGGAHLTTTMLDSLRSACRDSAYTCWRSSPSRPSATHVLRSSSTCWRTSSTSCSRSPSVARSRPRGWLSRSPSRTRSPL